MQSVWLNVKGQVLEFGKRTKSTIGNLTFKSKKVFFLFILQRMKIEPAIKVVIVTVNCYSYNKPDSILLQKTCSAFIRALPDFRVSSLVSPS